MGVRGLTSYIAQRAEIYLKPYELHNTALVIDGDNLACNLYKDVTGSYSAFGGDYDDFYRAVVQFFQVLAECSIRPYVLMDGGYEERKLRTVGERLRGKIAVIKRINPCASITLFPLHLKEVFVDAVRDCGVPVMRCVFEADDELAALARKLNCPVLSYDSDFYIHNVKYIPLITLTVKVLSKQKKQSKQPGKLRQHQAKHVEKRTKSNKIVVGIKKAEKEQQSKSNPGQRYKYLDCCIYRVEHLCGRGALSPEKLPLFAALLGNDYIARSAFRNFFTAGMGKAGRSRKLQQQQRRIRVILEWLKDQTAESALDKVLSRLKKSQRDSLTAQVQAAISGYSNELCHSYDFFEQHYENAFPYIQAESEPEEDEEDEEQHEGGEDQEEQEEQLEQEENEEQQEDVEQQEEKSLSDEESADESEAPEIESEDKTLLFPQWFLDKLYPAHLSRYFVDLLHLRKYINNPQIEHFAHHDANALALPILNYCFALLHHVKGMEVEQQLDEEGNPQPLEYTYLTRALRVTNVRYIHIPIDRPPALEFEPASTDVRHVRQIFKEQVKHANVEQLFEELEKLPKDLQLYFLAIVYWLHNSEHCDLLHLHALILSLVVLRTVDVTIPAERELKEFHRRFGKILKQERAVRLKQAAEGVKRGIKPELLELPVPQRMAHVPKSDCYLVQEQLLPHFHMQEIFKKKYDLYSTTVIHSFAEFQSVVYQLNGLNSLLNHPYCSPHMNQLFCGAFIYNLYDLLRNRADVRYHVQHFLLADSLLMFDFYCYLFDWCMQFVPHWKQQPEQQQTAAKVVEKKRMKKQRQAARKAAAVADSVTDPHAEQLQHSEPEEDPFFDLNNKFCGLKV